LDLSTIENYINNIDVIKTEDKMASCFSQSKSYLKIIGILYIKEGANSPINSSNVEKIIQSTHIFNNVLLTLKPCVIKTLLKFNMAILWIDIWDAQSGVKAKFLINRYFNISYSITTVRGVNMNLGISQCKNCWK